MNEINIEKNIPLPSPSRSHWKPILMKMKTGDSFAVPDLRTANSIRACAIHAGIKVTARNTGDGKMRVWKI